MIQAIRIEHDDGIGIFRDRDRILSTIQAVDKLVPSTYHRHNRFPAPFLEGLIICYDDFCAYKSIDQLQQWIMKNELLIIINHGYKIYLLELTTAQVGNYQIVYKKQDIINKTEITNLFL